MPELEDYEDDNKIGGESSVLDRFRGCQFTWEPSVLLLGPPGRSMRESGRLYAFAVPDTFEPLHIGISGMIGAGKTTLARELSQLMGLPLYCEPVIDNVYLDDFYKDMKAHSFGLQMYLLTRRFEQQQQIVWNKRGGVQDRTIYEDSIFAKMLRDSGLMTDRDYQTYRSMFRHLSNFMRRPNLIVHLDVSPEESLQRIQGRKRACESTITLEYLQKLHKCYEEFLDEISTSIRVIRVNWKDFGDTAKLARAVYEKHVSMRSIERVHL
jgi:deoxyadenosine kinase